MAVVKEKFTSFGEFLCKVQEACEPRWKKGLDPRLKTTGHMEEGVDSSGGFLVPEEFYADIMNVALEDSIIRPRATVVPMGSDRVSIPSLITTTRATPAVYGGIRSYWTPEATAVSTVSYSAQGATLLIAKKLMGVTWASDELRADSGIALDALLPRLFGASTAWFEDEAFIRGTGVGQPLGVINAGSTIGVTRGGSGEIRWADVVSMYKRLLPESKKAAVWIVNSDTLGELLEISTLEKGSSEAAPILVTGQPTEDGTWVWIYGKPVIESEHASVLGNDGDVILADFRYYLIGDRGDMAVDSSQDDSDAFVNDETCWRFVKRLDGQPSLDSAITPLRGTNTLSPFVILA